MTCRTVRRQLPLFTGDDLKAPEMSAVAGHVATCPACRAEVEAFTAARSLLPLASLSFGEPERELVRRRVLDEIARRGNPSPIVAFLLRPRVALAALAGVVVLAASLVSPFFIRRAVEPTALLPARPAPAETPAPVEAHVAEAAPLVPDRATAISRAIRAGSAPRSPVPASGKSGRAVRFEIQTGNVNVRIIWFSGGNSAGDASSDATLDANDVS